MKYISIVNWEKTQHYKNRTPPWIRLYVEILDKYDVDGKPKKFYKMPDTAKLTFIMLLCLSSRFNNNIPYETDKELKDMLGIKTLNLSFLVQNQYITIASKSDSVVDGKVLVTDTDTDTEGDTDTDNVLPHFIPQEIWKRFLNHRKAMKKPIAKDSYSLFYRKFEKWNKDGYSPEFVVNTIVERGWQGFKPEWVAKDMPAETTTERLICKVCGKEKSMLYANGVCGECEGL